MGRTKSSPKSSPSESSSGVEIRQRVTKACQRCRLKKCKCDGLNPCTRCRSDDAICAYAKQQQFDKIVYRRGYVQMLERQQAQLIAGIQAFYSMVQKGERLPPKPSEINRLGQPLVHQILQRLGVLDVDDPWDEVESEESKSESPTPKLDTVIHTNFPLQSRFSWPADTSSRGPVETSPPNSQISPQAWTMPSAGNTTLLPWVTAPCQLLDGEHRDTQAIARSTAGNYSYGDLSQWPRFGQDGLEQQTRGTLNQADPTYLTAYANQIPSSIGDPTALSGYSWSNLMGMTGDGNEQQQYL